MSITAKQLTLGSELSAEPQVYHFVVICPEAQAVFLVGDFNNWSTTATPMMCTDDSVWQISLAMPPGRHRFSYFVVDRKYRTGQAAFGNTYLLPGSWAAVLRESVNADVPVVA